jgi:endoglucanase
MRFPALIFPIALLQLALPLASTLTLTALAQSPAASPAPPAKVPASLATNAAACGVARPSSAMDLKLPTPSANQPLLRQTWLAYRDRFIQKDGRVVDFENPVDLRSTSEGQAYAMMRAVWINDREVFDRTLNWAEGNLNRKGLAIPDQLWSWKWGKVGDRWRVLDANFASDADVDAIVALIWASRRWQCPQYLDLAKTKLRDLWTLSIINVGDNRYQLPGPKEAFWQQSDRLIWNPSYFAPYAYRLFAQVDPERDWKSLIPSGYRALQASTEFSSSKLPADWIALNPTSGQLSALPEDSPLKTIYSFDAYRTWWRINLDLSWNNAPEAKTYLREGLKSLQTLWKSQKKLPARLMLDGKPASDYEATSHYAMVYAGLTSIDRPLAQQIYQQKIAPTLKNNFWDNNNAYYSNNMVWLALFSSQPPNKLLKP